MLRLLAMVLRSLLQRLSYLCLGISLLALCSCGQPLLQSTAPSPAIAQSPSASAQASAQPTYPKQITVKELAQRIEAGDESYWLIDVRTKEEVAIATIPTSTHIPIAEITDGSAIERLLAEQEGRQIILHCYSGVRSRRAQKHLTGAGIATTDLKGGIKAWRKQIDPSLPKKLLP